MNEWPTRVRIGVPPSSRTISGTAFEQIRLCTTFSPGFRSRIGRGQHRGGGGARHRLRLVVDEHHAVGVAVEREADGGVVVEHRALEVLEVLDRGRVGRVVRERAVELAEQEGELDRQAGEHGRRDQPADAVGGVGDDPQRAERVEVDERVDVGDERGQQVALLGATRVLGALEEPTGDHGLDLGEAGVLPDRQRRRPGTASRRCTGPGCGWR